MKCDSDFILIKYLDNFFPWMYLSLILTSLKQKIFSQRDFWKLGPQFEKLKPTLEVEVINRKCRLRERPSVIETFFSLFFHFHFFGASERAWLEHEVRQKTIMQRTFLPDPLHNTHVHTLTHTHAHSHTHTYIHIHTHTTPLVSYSPLVSSLSLSRHTRTPKHVYLHTHTHTSRHSYPHTQ